jgi:hypothetical protein
MLYEQSQDALSMKASTCVESKRYVASANGNGIIHDICLEPEDNSRFRTVYLDNIFFILEQG